MSFWSEHWRSSLSFSCTINHTPTHLHSPPLTQLHPPHTHLHIETRNTTTNLTPTQTDDLASRHQCRFLSFSFPIVSLPLSYSVSYVLLSLSVLRHSLFFFLSPVSSLPSPLLPILSSLFSLSVFSTLLLSSHSSSSYVLHYSLSSSPSPPFLPSLHSLTVITSLLLRLIRPALPPVPSIPYLPLIT